MAESYAYLTQESIFMLFWLLNNVHDEIQPHPSSLTGETPDMDWVSHREILSQSSGDHG